MSTRLDVRTDLRRHLEATGLPTLVVTHDPIDAHVLADRVVVLEEGRVSQQGRLTELAAHPATSYVADLADVNLLEGRLDGAVLTTPSGMTVHGTRLDADTATTQGLAAVAPA